MRTPDLTLDKARKDAKGVIREHRVSDFLTSNEIKELHETNKEKRIQPKFDEVDALIGEILARFGYDTYIAWKSGAIDTEMIIRYLEAERCREAQNRYKLECIIVASVAGANRPNKQGYLPKSMRLAIAMLDKEKQKAEVK